MTTYAWRTDRAPEPDKAAQGAPQTGWVHESHPPWRVIVSDDPLMDGFEMPGWVGRVAQYDGAEPTVTVDEWLPENFPSSSRGRQPGSGTAGETQRRPFRHQPPSDARRLSDLELAVRHLRYHQDRIDAVVIDQMHYHDGRTERIDNHLGGIDRRLDGTGRRFGRIDVRLDTISRQLANTENLLRDILNRLPDRPQE